MNFVSCATGTEWVDPEDPTVIAENELLGAAAAIEAAAKKLEQLRPRTKPKVREAFLTAPAASVHTEPVNLTPGSHAPLVSLRLHHMNHLRNTISLPVSVSAFLSFKIFPDGVLILSAQRGPPVPVFPFFCFNNPVTVCLLAVGFLLL